jgi:hypothetical protein
MDDDVVDAIKRTVECMDRAGLPSDLRGPAFRPVFDRVVGTSPRPAVAPRRERVGESQVASSLEPIATRVGLPVDVIEQVYEFTPGGELQIVVPAARLEAAKSRAAQQIAALVAFGRQTLGLDENNWTPIEHVRVICQDFNKYDEGNFASSIRTIDGMFKANVRGNGRQREIRMTRESWPLVANLIRDLTGSSEA